MKLCLVMLVVMIVGIVSADMFLWDMMKDDPFAMKSKTDDFKDMGDWFEFKTSMGKLKPEDISVSISGHTLTVRAHAVINEVKNGIKLQERVNWKRTLRMDDTISSNDVISTVHNGKLKLKVMKPKSQQMKHSDVIEITLKDLN